MAFKIVSYHSQPVSIMPYHSQVPPGTTQIVLTVHVGYITATGADDPFFSQRTLCFSLNLLQSPRRLHQVLAPKLEELNVDMSSEEYEGVLYDIMQCGIETVRGARDQGQYCLALQLHSDIYVAPMDMDMDMDMSDQESLMTRALSESRREFENNHHGMVGAAESSVKEMVKKVKVEDGEKGDCMVCLEELMVGFEASQMPCSHVFHGGCIERWLKQSHYCPICRFEMPTN